MTLEELLSAWEADGAIDKNQLTDESVETPKLHAKYLRILMENKRRLAKLRSDYNVIRQDKFRYYRGEMTREELQERGWEQWQYAKPLKNEMDEFLKGDADLNKYSLRIEYTLNFIEATELIMDQIKTRNWQIRNAIAWTTFMAGN